MTIAEIEPYVDSLLLKKLEVKMKKGRQIRLFICADNVVEYSERVYGDIIVFDGDGKAWKLDNQCWDKERGIEVKVSDLSENSTIYHNTYLTANGVAMKRVVSLDYKALKK